MNEFWAAIAGAIVGAVVGGIISYLLQRQNLNEARRQRKDEATERNRTLAFALVFKMNRTYSNLRLYNLHLTQHTGRSAAATELSWQMVEPIANSSEYIHFTTDEVVLLLNLGDLALFNEVIEMDSRHNAVVAVFEDYRSRREAITRALPVVLRGNMATATLTPDELCTVAPMMVATDSLLKQAAQMLEEAERDALSILQRLFALISDKMGVELQYHILADDEALAKSGKAGAK